MRSRTDGSLQFSSDTFKLYSWCKPEEKKGAAYPEKWGTGSGTPQPPGLLPASLPPASCLRIPPSFVTLTSNLPMPAEPPRAAAMHAASLAISGSSPAVHNSGPPQRNLPCQNPTSGSPWFQQDWGPKRLIKHEAQMQIVH